MDALNKKPENITMVTDTKNNQLKINQVSENLFLITLDPGIRGFENFIGTWLYRGEVNFIVDVGPSVTAPGLINTLKNIGISHLDYILLTHIHIDHAGGIREIADHFKQTPIVCHKAGIHHLAEPKRLWEATNQTLGPIADAYGPIRGVDPSRFLDAEKLHSVHIKTILTPGHSPHHVSFQKGPFLFAGEAAGVSLAVSSGQQYLRPATPPRFFLETNLSSIDAMVENKAEMICYGHFGIRNNATEMLLKHKEQLFLWKKIIHHELESSPKKDFISDCLNLLLQHDMNLEGFFALNKSAQERERGFLTNSIRGFAGYLESLADNS